MVVTTGLLMAGALSARSEEKPNVLFIIMDDQSWEHLGCYGDPAIRTPHIDSLAKNGVRFDHAYCAVSSCSPSRAAILMGQDIWRLETAGVLWGSMPKRFVCFSETLAQNGYHVGATGKTFWPTHFDKPHMLGRVPAPSYNAPSTVPKDAPKNTPKSNYSGSMQLFLDKNTENKPFFFWCGVGEPHVPYAAGIGKKSGIDFSKIKVPGFLPDTPEVRESLANYLAEIEYADGEVGKILALLRERKLMDTTLIIFTSDNGMPFPRAKATLYDHGARMPLLMQWNGRIKAGRIVTDPVSLIDIAPTILDVAALDIPAEMTGKSLQPTLLSKKSGRVDTVRNFVMSASESHTGCRPGKTTFPRRAVHTEKWTYIVNYEPDRMPAGTFDIHLNDHWGAFGDVDPTIAKFFLIENKDDSNYKKYFDYAFSKVVREQLFNKEKDPYMLNNLADNPEYGEIKATLAASMNARMKETNDPRIKGEDPWTEYLKIPFLDR